MNDQQRDLAERIIEASTGAESFADRKSAGSWLQCHGIRLLQAALAGIDQLQEANARLNEEKIELRLTIKSLNDAIEARGWNRP